MTIHFNEGWTDNRVKQLKSLWDGGLSCSQIASEMACGFTRNAIIGKVMRLHLPPRGRRSAMPGAAPAPRKPRSPRAPALFVSNPRRNPRHSLAEKLRLAEADRGIAHIDISEKPDGTGIKFHELRPNTCRWPKGDPTEESFEFCGCKSIPDLPYCAHHTRRAHRAYDVRS